MNLPKDRVIEALKTCGISETIRAEALTMEQLGKVYTEIF